MQPRTGRSEEEIVGLNKLKSPRLNFLRSRFQLLLVTKFTEASGGKTVLKGTKVRFIGSKFHLFLICVLEMLYLVLF